ADQVRGLRRDGPVLRARRRTAGSPRRLGGTGREHHVPAQRNCRRRAGRSEARWGAGHHPGPGDRGHLAAGVGERPHPAGHFAVLPAAGRGRGGSGCRVLGEVSEMTAMTESAAQAPTDDVLLQCTGLRKSFGNVHAIREASIRLPRGEVTAIIGDNGAGKSTLVRCLVGVHQPDAGEYLFDGRPAVFDNPEAAREAGIETVHQNLALVDDLTVWQNLFLNREITRGIGPFALLDRRAMKRRSRELMSGLAINMPPVTARVDRLSGGQRQAVALSRAAGWGSK